MEQLWQRVSQGRHTALLGVPAGEPPAALGLHLVRVRCDVPEAALGPLLEARRKVDRLVGGAPPLLDQARSRVVSGLRRRLLGDLADAAGDADFIEAVNRLAQHGGGPSAIVMESVEHADEATLDVLRRVMSRPDALRAPLVLSFGTSSPEGAAGALAAAVRAVCGPEAVLRAREEAAELPSDASAAQVDASAALPDVPPDVLRVLRVGAVVGQGFEADLAAALLDARAIEVLEALQRAADAGVPIEDRGEGRFHLPQGLLDRLRATTLPSLARAWHRRLADILSAGPIAAQSEGAQPEDAPPEAERARRDQDAEVLEDEAPADAPQADTPQADASEAAGARADAPPAAGDAFEAAADAAEPSAAPSWPYAEIFSGAPDLDPPPAAPDAASHEPDATAAARADAAPSAPEPERERAPAATDRRGSEAATRADAGRGDAARAAAHLTAAGELEEAARRYCAAMAQATAVGAHAQALAYGQKALALLDRMPVTPSRRQLRVLTLTEIGRVQWHASGPDPAFTLTGALEVVDAAQRLLRPDDPPALHTEVAVLLASICYDLGDMRSLERALSELTAASRLLLHAGDAVGSARLLNDQAAVYVRMGDPVRATHLLSESRRVFEERAKVDPIARVEIAETDHLFARIPLHVRARPGRESDALSMGLDHALAAERTYKALGAHRELGRVWETMGRLELRKGRLDRAVERLTSAIEVQQSIGDLVGLARSTAALSEVLAASGKHRDALMLLSDSVAMNLEKGSPIGLAFNRRTLSALAPKVARDPVAADALKQVSMRLARAESVLGRLSLPGEPD